MEWKVLKALNPDTERQHLNKILADIRATVDAVKVTTQVSNDVNSIKAVVASMVEGNTETGISVQYNALKKVLDFVVSNFTLTLTGDVTGAVTVTGLNSATISTTLDPALGGVEDVEMDNNTYWRRNQTWEAVNPMLVSLNSLTDDGFTVVYTDSAGDPQFAARSIEGTTDEIDVADGDGAAGNPVISLADLTNTGIGSSPVKIYTRDAKGRIEGDEDADTDNLPEGVINLYFTDERAQDAVGAAIAAGTGDGASLTYNDAGNAINIANTDKGSVAVTAHEAESDPHPQYLTATEGNAAYAPLSHVGTGGAAHAQVIASGAAGFMSGTDKAKLDLMTSGSYTPTVTGVTNIDSTTSYLCYYSRNGNYVVVSGRIDLDATAAGVASQVDISLPIASNLSGAGQLGGAMSVFAAGQSVAASVFPETTNDRARCLFSSITSASHACSFQFGYWIA